MMFLWLAWMCDECILHHKTFLVWLYQHLAIHSCTQTSFWLDSVHPAYKPLSNLIQCILLSLNLLWCPPPPPPPPHSIFNILLGNLFLQENRGSHFLSHFQSQTHCLWQQWNTIFYFNQKSWMLHHIWHGTDLHKENANFCLSVFWYKNNCICFSPLHVTTCSCQAVLNTLKTKKAARLVLNPCKQEHV